MNLLLVFFVTLSNVLLYGVETVKWKLAPRTRRSRSCWLFSSCREMRCDFIFERAYFFSRLFRLFDTFLCGCVMPYSVSIENWEKWKKTEIEIQRDVFNALPSEIGIKPWAMMSVQHVFPHMLHTKETTLNRVIYLGFMYCKQSPNK